MAYTPPLFSNITIGPIEAAYSPPAYNNIIISLTSAIGRRAIYMDGSVMKVIPDNLLGTGVQPLVVETNGSIHPRAGVEGTPIVWFNNGLRTLPESDYLII